MRRVFGRHDERERIHDLLGSAAPGPRGLLFVGDPGIGKSTLFRAAVDAASGRGMTVLSCRPSPADTQLDYAGLSDLVEPMVDELDALPETQRRAMLAVTARADAGAPSAATPRLVAAATRSLLDHAGSRGPFMLAVDDLQWLDPRSRQALDFALRRSAAPLRAVFTSRQDDEPELSELDALRVVRLAPLPLDDVARIVADRSELAADEASLLRPIALTAGGNPFYAIELADAWAGGRMPRGTLPPTLQLLVDARLADLPRPAREVLALAAAMPEPTTSFLSTVFGADRVDEAIASAESAEVASVAAGLVEFAHPLVAAGVYSGMSPAERRRVHRRIAAHTDDEEARARHLALSVVGPTPEVLEAIDLASASARARGATAIAADLQDMALALGDPSPQRKLRAALDHFDTDDFTKAARLAAAAGGELRDPGERAEALGLLGVVQTRRGEFGPGMASLRGAIALASERPALRASLAIDLGLVLANAGSCDEAYDNALTAVHDAELAGDDGLLAEALGGRAVIGVMCGHGLDAGAADRALELERPDRNTPAARWAVLNVAMCHTFMGDHARALEEFALAHARSTSRGHEADLWFIAFWASAAALGVGDGARAARHADEVAVAAKVTGSPVIDGMARLAEARLAMWNGDDGAARAKAASARAVFTEISTLAPIGMAAGAEASALLRSGDPEAAVALFTEASATMTGAGLRHPGCLGDVGDLLDAFIAAGRLDEASAYLSSSPMTRALPTSRWLRGVRLRAEAALAREAHDE
ncbi:ATP-binding protein, partial [Agromyces soli]